MSTTIANMFGKSPFKALQGHMRVVLECAREIPPLFEALIAGDQERVVAIKNKIFEKEAAADIGSLKIRLSPSWVTEKWRRNASRGKLKTCSWYSTLLSITSVLPGDNLWKWAMP